ncbi:NADPH-dependent FMN reductase [Frigoriflavimonas asaccharolytica]|uniref:NAD(P)H-dependent FMN reductase n=1 Tax=Frigoriflavimonas asaccharolytica TaxID=2735899 RepID=A0A8J8G649_9FLAO|nr:NAD(P)H-dependent oxidoreductase [Frigoriflavimonas asaccharolytica]NRS91838.1 NAD(P)H-dependent FMN reductase [Frigoriflavimonas asaccharolytica]
MKILAFAGSISSDSINHQFVTYVTTLFPNQEIEILDLNDYQMEMFSSDKEKEIGVHPVAKKFAEKIDESNAIFISLAEYNSSYAGGFKNTFDWLSRVKDRKHFGEKPMFLLSTAPGPGGGKNVSAEFMRRAPFSGANIIADFSLPKWKENFEAGKGITNEELNHDFMKKIEIVKESLGISN